VNLKFNGQLGPAQLLGTLMAQRLAARGAPLPELLIPVPLHAARLQRRGYNQALELGRVLAGQLSLQLAPTGARRLRPTREQTALSAAERRRNVRGAFAVSTAVRGRHVALLDDVITTGNTVAELARAARKAGAARVEVWAVARALGQAPLREVFLSVTDAVCGRENRSQSGWPSRTTETRWRGPAAKSGRTRRAHRPHRAPV
jgi:ComF family protein